MYPELFHTGSFTIYTYGAMFALGLLLAAFLASRDADAVGLSAGAVFDMSVGVAISGIVGARLLFVFSNFSTYAENPLDVFKLWEGGLIFHGGFVAALIYMAFEARRHKKPFFGLLDFLLPYTALAHAVGRVGCFLNGCCYGRPFNGAWAVTFPFLDEPVHPVQLYEAAGNVALFLVLKQIDRRKRMNGKTTAFYFMGYAALRTAMEYFRGDKSHAFFGFATETQLFFGVVFLIGALMYGVLRTKKAA